MSRLFNPASNFTIVSNNIVGDPELSWKAKGIFLYLCSKPDGWEFFMHEIKMNATDGIKSVRAGIAELEERGYLKRIKGHNEKGQICYDYQLNFDKIDKAEGKKRITTIPKRACG